MYEFGGGEIAARADDPVVSRTERGGIGSAGGVRAVCVVRGTAK